MLVPSHCNLENTILMERAGDKEGRGHLGVGAHPLHVSEHNLGVRGQGITSIMPSACQPQRFTVHGCTKQDGI